MECPVCLGTFDTQARRPKNLPCGHSFCLRCLSHLEERKCPLDGKEFAVDPVDLPDVLALLAAPRRRVWCRSCRAEAKDVCYDDHSICSLKKARIEGSQSLFTTLQEAEQHATVVVAELTALVGQRCAELADLRTQLQAALGSDDASWARAKANIGEHDLGLRDRHVAVKEEPDESSVEDTSPYSVAEGAAWHPASQAATSSNEEDHVPSAVSSSRSEKPHKCEVCVREFASLASLSRHSRALHSNGKKHKCEVCLKKFASLAGLTTHTSALHSDGKKHKCEVCLQALYDLIAHNKALHPDGKHYKSKCDECLKEFPSMNCLLSHKSAAHRYHCDTCHKTFSLKLGLNQHKLAVHSAPKSYKCDVCKKKFLKLLNAERHKFNEHDGKKCDVCQKAFSKFEGFKKHKLKVHTGGKLLQCDVCEKNFSGSSSLDQHKRVGHQTITG